MDTKYKSQKKYYQKKYTIKEDMTEEQKAIIIKNIELRRERDKEKYRANKQVYIDRAKEYYKKLRNKQS